MELAAGSAATVRTEQAVTQPLVAASVLLGSAASAVRQVPRPPPASLETGGIPRRSLVACVLYHTSQNRLQGRNVRRGMPAALQLRWQRALRPSHGALPVSPGENRPQVRFR